MSQPRLTAALARIFLTECEEWLADMHPKNPWRPAVVLRRDSLNKALADLERPACGKQKEPSTSDLEAIK